MQLIDLFPFWDDTRSGLLAAVSDLTPAQRAWVPKGGVNSIEHLVRHIAAVHERDVTGFVRGCSAADPDSNDWPSLLALLRQRQDELTAFLQETPAEAILQTRPFLGEARTISDALWNACQEEIHHRGQILMLLRLMGRGPAARSTPVSPG